MASIAALELNCRQPLAASARIFAGAALVDGDPDTAAYLRETLGIAPDYYTAVAPDPTESDIVRIRETINRVTGRPSW